MGSAQTGQAISGAAQGAAAGAAFGPYGAAVGAGIGFVGGLISGGSADAQNANQAAWAHYNVQSQFNTDIYNLNSQAMFTMFNAMAGMKAAGINADAAEAIARYNAEIIAATVGYNNKLLEVDLERVWEDAGLALVQLETFRAVERGAIRANQAASGTVLDEGGNRDVIEFQMTQEAMDALIIRHGADRQAADIMNAMAQGTWQGEVAIGQTIWEGELAGFQIRQNAAIQATTELFGGMIQLNAGIYNAEQRQYTGNINIMLGQEAFSAQNTQDMVAGLFQAGATFGAGAYAREVPGDKLSKPATLFSAGTTTGGGGGTSLAYGGYSPIREPGRSLATGLG